MQRKVERKLLAKTDVKILVKKAQRKVVGEKQDEGLKCRKKQRLRETSEQAEMMAGWSSCNVITMMMTMVMIL